MLKVLLVLISLLLLVGCIIMIGRDNQGSIRSKGDFDPQQELNVDLDSIE